MKNINRIAIVRLSALGDIVNSAIVLQFIKQKYPNIVIEWITEEVFSSLLINHPFIDKVHPLNLKKLKTEKSFSHLKETINYLKSLGSFDLVIDIQGLIKSSIVARIVSKNTHGFSKDSTREGLASLLYKTTSVIAYDENIVRRNCFVVSDGLGFKIDDEMILNKEVIFPHLKLKDKTKYNFSKDKKNIAIVIGASWESKKYTKEKVVELCDKLKENCFIVWGNEQEKNEAEYICKNSNYAQLTPKLSLSDLVAFIGEMDLLIGNDTGPTHMAWGQNIPSITLFGPTNSRMIYETKKNLSLKSPSDVDLFKIDKNDFSIKEIKVDDILDYARRLLNV